MRKVSFLPLNLSHTCFCLITELKEYDFVKATYSFLRCGFAQRYLNGTEEERQKWGQGGSEQLAGLEQGEDMLEFLWDNHFAAVASEQSALERWPVPRDVSYLYETLLVFFWNVNWGTF